MEAMALSIPMFAFAGLVGRDLLINTVTCTARGIIGIVSYLSSSDEPGTEKINDILEKVDINHKITVLNSLINDLSSNNELPESTIQAITGLQDILDNIHSELEEIQNKVKNHKQKWFYYWRTINAKKSLSKIERHVIVLSERTTMLMDLLLIPTDKLKSSIIPFEGDTKRSIKNLSNAVINNYN